MFKTVLLVLCFPGSDTETWLEDGRHHPWAEEGDQDYEHGGVHAHDGLVTGTDWAYWTDAGQETLKKHFRLSFAFCLHPPSSFISMHCFQTGPQGSSISSGRRGVDQRKRSHEVMEITTFGNQEQFCKCIDRSWNSILTSSWWMCLYGRAQTKDIFNGQFGSLFRTYHNPTYFSRRLSRFADIYMASISCLLNYDLQHTFFPRRTPLQHESPFWPEHSPAGISVSSPFHRVDGN